MARSRSRSRDRHHHKKKSSSRRSRSRSRSRRHRRHERDRRHRHRHSSSDSSSLASTDRDEKTTTSTRIGGATTSSTLASNGTKRLTEVERLAEVERARWVDLKPLYSSINDVTHTLDAISLLVTLFCHKTCKHVLSTLWVIDLRRRGILFLCKTISRFHVSL